FYSIFILFASASKKTILDFDSLNVYLKEVNVIFALLMFKLFRQARLIKKEYFFGRYFYAFLNKEVSIV
ncbi:MAG: hypothetical protein ACI9Q3_000514, partial [Maribacter sp.]